MALPLALLISLAPVLPAQRAVPTVDLGGSVVRYADSVSSSAATISPSIRLEADRATLGAGGTYSQSAGSWSTQGVLHSSLFTPTLGSFLGELSGSAGGSAHQDGTRTGQALAVIRAHLMTPQRGAWGGAGAGSTWDGIAWHPVRLAEVGAWTRFGTTTALATVTPTAVSDTIRYADAELALRFDLPGAEIGLAGGARAGDRLPTIRGSARSWGSLSVAGWIASSTALVASAGSYPVDFTQGFPGGRFVSLGVRFGPRTSHRDATTDVATTLATLRAPTNRPLVVTAESVLELRVDDAGAGRRTFRVLAPRATTVEIMGDFTSWAPVPLAQVAGGWWTIALPVSSGTHEMNLRASGAGWVVPPGLTAIDDEFGGAVGVLVVP
ncbi:MAG TPA: glycogen-binding domain-containing protein [Gemmatimonadaceae bacterium]|nr:glycogen-binding domain-containing protein [Gemmatimonadaceae bacterium]